ncbi:hypothetical protein [Aeromonas caviae]|uniref:hypothetical protein n=1 Tax=Aeromonas caviae TaxID=648 RepID=UPI00385F8759
MSVKTTGAEFKRFYNDPATWAGDVWLKNALLLVEGWDPGEEVDVQTLPDEAIVTIQGGVIVGPAWEGQGPSLQASFKRWVKGIKTSPKETSMTEQTYPTGDFEPEYPPCAVCGKPNDIGELCAECAQGNDPLSVDIEGPGGWMVQDGKPS